MSKDQNTKKRLQVLFSEEAWSSIESLTEEANRGFEDGSITYSDVVNEMILNSKFDIKTLQAKHTDIKRSLRRMASQGDVDLDSAIKALMELKNKVGKRGSKQSANSGDSTND